MPCIKRNQKSIMNHSFEILAPTILVGVTSLIFVACSASLAYAAGRIFPKHGIDKTIESNRCFTHARTKILFATSHTLYIISFLYPVTYYENNVNHFLSGDVYAHQVFYLMFVFIPAGPMAIVELLFSLILNLPMLCSVFVLPISQRESLSRLFIGAIGATSVALVTLCSALIPSCYIGPGVLLWFLANVSIVFATRSRLEEIE